MLTTVIGAYPKPSHTHARARLVLMQKDGTDTANPTAHYLKSNL